MSVKNLVSSSRMQKCFDLLRPVTFPTFTHKQESIFKKRGRTDKIRALGIELCEDGKNPAMLPHDRLDQGSHAVQDRECTIRHWPILEVSKRLDIRFRHGGQRRTDCGKRWWTDASSLYRGIQTQRRSLLVSSLRVAHTTLKI
jgi:hypothetical protein